MTWLASIIDYFEKDFVTVDWDVRSLRVVHAAADRRGVEVIDPPIAVSIPASVNATNAEDMGRLIRQAFDQQGIDAGRMTVDVPRDQVIFKTLKVPKAAPNDMPSVVEFQVSKELPFPVSEAVIDFTVVDESDAATCDVVVAAVRHEVLDFYRSVAEHAGLRLERVGLRPSANAVAVTEVLKRTAPERVLFVDVGPTLTEIDIIRRGRLVFSRSGSVPMPEGRGGRLVDPGPALEEAGVSLRFPSVAPESETAAVVRSLLLEVTRSIENYRSFDPNVKIDHIVVGGGCGVEDELAEALQQRLNAPAETFNPATVLGWDADRGAAACAFAATLGLAFGHAREGRLQFDFLHPKRTVPPGRERLQRAPLQAVAAVLLIGAGIVAYWQVIMPQRRQLAAIKAEVAEGNKLIREQEELGKLVAQADEFDREQVVWVDAVRDLVEVLPSNKEAIITKLDMNGPDRRIKVAFAAKQRGVSDQAIAALDAYERDEKRLFEANATQITEATGRSYPYESQLMVRMLGKEKPSANTRGRR